MWPAEPKELPTPASYRGLSILGVEVLALNTNLLTTNQVAMRGNKLFFRKWLQEVPFSKGIVLFHVTVFYGFCNDWLKMTFYKKRHLIDFFDQTRSQIIAKMMNIFLRKITKGFIIDWKESKKLVKHENNFFLQFFFTFVRILILIPKESITK